jgi:DNA repair protein RAD50
MPPNSNKGKNFVHDPKVIGDTEVKAQIRLKFRAVNKKPMVTIRSFQLTQKKDKTEFKQLEAVIQTKDEKTGKVVTQSHKCTDMDTLLPQCLGVTTAVLENVIFCHQEDVNWPLSDSSTLKKKFDDIFASTRYTKALDSIRKLKKEQTSQLKDYQGDLGALEAYRDTANKLKKDAEMENHKIENIRAQMEDIDKQLEPIQRAITKYEKEQEKLGEFNAQITKLEGVCAEMEKNVKELYDQMENEFDETDDEIRQFEKDFEKQLQDLLKEKEAAQKGLQHAKEEREKVIAAAKKDEARLSALRHEKELLKRKIDDMCSEIYALAKRYKIQGYENPPYADQQ